MTVVFILVILFNACWEKKKEIPDDHNLQCQPCHHRVALPFGGGAAIKRQLKTGGQMEAFAHDQFIRLWRSKKKTEEGKNYIVLKENA